MRYLWIMAAAAFAFRGIAAFAQSSSSNTETRIPDINGGFSTAGPTYAASKSATGSSRTELAISINGQMVPRESVEEKIISQGPSGRVVERYVRRFDATGNPGPLEKTLIEERKSGSTTTITSTVLRGDFDGNFHPAERTVSRAVTQGTTTLTNTTVERTGMDGLFTVAERVNAVLVQETKENQRQTVTRMRSDGNGNFYEAVREVSSKQTPANGQVVENRVQYVDGALAEQSVSRTIPSANGASTTTIDVFSTQSPGLSPDLGGKLALKERQQILVQPGANGTLTQTITSAKPGVTDANILGPPQVLSQIICKGACKP